MRWMLVQEWRLLEIYGFGGGTLQDTNTTTTMSLCTKGTVLDKGSLTLIASISREKSPEIVLYYIWNIFLRKL